MVPKLKDFTFEPTATGIRAAREGDKKVRQQKNFTDDMDQAFPNGTFTEPNGKVPNIRFRDMHNWCQKNGRNPETLTREELKQFLIK